MLGCDAIFNTIIYSGDSDYDDWYKKCAMSIFVQQFILVSVIVVYMLRMYRVYKLYHSYEKYLGDQAAVEFQKSVLPRQQQAGRT